MSETPFIAMIDTEGDDLWARPRGITTRNAGYPPRFQALCERFRFKTVYAEGRSPIRPNALKGGKAIEWSARE